MDIPKVPREGLPMQDLAGCDNNRTPVKFQRYDNYNFVGDITVVKGPEKQRIELDTISWQLRQ